jgi:hypothetical protein
LTEPTTKTTPQDRALRRIRGLLDKAESTTFEGEREDLMAKATELMSDYGINEAMANARGQIREKIIKKMIQIGNPYSYDKTTLLNWLAVELNCTVINYKRRVVHVSAMIIGYESDVARLEMLYTSLLMQALRQLRNVRPPGPRVVAAWTREFRQNWFQGFNIRVAARVRESEKRAAQKFDSEHGSGGTLPVLADRRVQVEAVKVELFPELKDFRGRARGDYGRGEGLRAGDRADIGNDKVESGGQRKIGS